MSSATSASASEPEAPSSGTGAAGRVARLGSGVYNATKWGVGAFSESLRQEALNYNVRVTIIEPGYVATELQAHNFENPMVKAATEKMRAQTSISSVFNPSG